MHTQQDLEELKKLRDEEYEKVKEQVVNSVVNKVALEENKLSIINRSIIAGCCAVISILATFSAYDKSFIVRPEENLLISGGIFAAVTAGLIASIFIKNEITRKNMKDKIRRLYRVNDNAVRRYMKENNMDKNIVDYDLQIAQMTNELDKQNHYSINK